MVGDPNLPTESGLLTKTRSLLEVEGSFIIIHLKDVKLSAGPSQHWFSKVMPALFSRYVVSGHRDLNLRFPDDHGHLSMCLFTICPLGRNAFSIFFPFLKLLYRNNSRKLQAVVKRARGGPLNPYPLFPDACIPCVYGAISNQEINIGMMRVCVVLWHFIVCADLWQRAPRLRHGMIPSPQRYPSFLLPSRSPVHHWSVLCVYNIAILRMSCKWNHTTGDILTLVFHSASCSWDPKKLFLGMSSSLLLFAE